MPPKDAQRQLVREFRQALGVTQAQFAMALGISYASVQRYEGSVPPRGKAWLKLALLARERGLPEFESRFLAEVNAPKMERIADRRAIAQLVSSLRSALKLTQREFAARLGVDRSSVGRYEVGEQPSDEVLVSLARIAKENELHDLEQSFLHALAAQFLTEMSSASDLRAEEIRANAPNAAPLIRDIYRTALQGTTGKLEPKQSLQRIAELSLRLADLLVFTGRANLEKTGGKSW